MNSTMCSNFHYSLLELKDYFPGVNIFRKISYDLTDT